MKYQAIRQAIQTLVDEQVTFKPQRKTVHFKGTRTLDSRSAFYKVLANKQKLRNLYAAYAILKGVERPLPTKLDTFTMTQDRILTADYVKKYTVKVTNEDKVA